MHLIRANRNIIELSSNSTSTETFDEIHQDILDGISDNIASLVESGKYGAINTTDTSTNGFYAILFTSGVYTPQENTTIDGQILIAGELVVSCLYINAGQSMDIRYTIRETVTISTSY